MYAERGKVVIAVWRDEDDVHVTPELFDRVCAAFKVSGVALGPRDVAALAEIGERTQ